MRKFKVVRKWPHGPNVGTILSSSCEYSECDLSNSEFLEEVKEPESVWYLESNGVVYESEGDSGVPSWLLFRTKESAENFAKELKDSHGTMIDREKHDTQSIWTALNDRVK